MFVSCLVFSGAAELQGLDNSVWVNSEYNWSLEFQTRSNYSYSNITVRNETLQLEEDNISILHGSGQRVNTTLYTYNLSSSPELGDELIKIEVNAPSGSQVDFTFTGIPQISSERYELNGENQLSTFSSGGAVSWSYSDWNTAHNFTLTYNEKPEGDNDDGSSGSGGGGGGIDLDSGSTGTDSSGSSDSKNWAWTDKKNFEFNDIQPDIEVTNISVNTRENQSNFEVKVEKIQDKSSAPSIDNSYAIYEINTSASDNEISSTSIRFQVNQSYASNYDNISLQRYQDMEWNQLPTQPVKQEGRKWLYEASSTGFSYYAVTGENQTTNTEPDGQEIDGRNATETDPGENRTEDDSSNQNQENPTQQQEETGNESSTSTVQEHGDQSLVTEGLITAAVLLLLAAISFFGYREWRQHQVEKEAMQIRRKLKEENYEVLHSERIPDLLNQAEQAVSNDNYSKAKKHLDQIQELLE